MTTEQFTEKVRRMRPMLIGVARRIVNDDEEAEDVVQDTLLKLWLVRDEVDNLPGMARVMVRHQCLDIIRRRQPMLSVNGIEPADSEDDTTDERIERMMTLVATLPTMQQTVLRLRHMQGMEMRDIARIVGSSEVAVRQSLSRARRTLFDKMRYDSNERLG